MELGEEVLAERGKALRAVEMCLVRTKAGAGTKQEDVARSAGSPIGDCARRGRSSCAVRFWLATGFGECDGCDF